MNPRPSNSPSILSRLWQTIDPVLIAATIPIMTAGLVTMNAFSGTNIFFEHQIVWIVIAVVLFLSLSFLDMRFLRRPEVVVALFLAVTGLLVLLFVIGHISRGAESWFRLGLFSIEPSDPAQIVLVVVLAKYFSRRHIEIANIRHIIISGI